MKDATYITVLLDRSGSMGSVKSDTIGGFNQFISEQKKVGDNANLTLVQFDSQGVDTIHENKPIKDVPELTDATYQPRGSTPLLDALGDSIAGAGKILTSINENSRPDKVVFVIITDGQENASHRFTREQIKASIQHQTDVYKWNFVYLGANQDAFAEAGQIGINAATVANYSPNQTKRAFGTFSANIVGLRKSGNASSLSYSDKQRTDLQDKQ